MTTDALGVLRRAAPADTERTAHAYGIDGLLPRAAFSPTDRHELAGLLHAASEQGLVVVPQGARTALEMGRPLDRYDVALDVRGLRRVVAYVPEDLTVTVEAGCSLRHLQDALAEHGQYLPLDPPPDDDVTIGGLLATARIGPWRSHMPGPRDLVLGMTVALPDGSIARSGGRVVKNVSGYDLHRLHTGALGALGVIVEASFKVAPRPPVTRDLVVRCYDERQGPSIAAALRDAPLAARSIAVLEPRAAAHAGLPREPHVLVDLAGSAPAVDESTALVERAAREAGSSARLAERSPWRRLRALAGDGTATVLRLGVPSASTERTIRAVAAADCLAWGFPASGSVVGFAEHGLEAGAVTALREHARSLGGYLQIECGSTELRRRVTPIEADDLALIASLQDRFDPHRILNRGRWPA